jgi:ParB family chromosome partitioning protein
VKHNPRSDLGDLTELRTSISDWGILNPLLVVKTAVGFELLGGHRRLECAKQLALTHVPCRIVKTEEPEVIKILDNIMREDVAPEDLCIGLKRLLAAFDGNKSALARAISKSPSYVNRAVKAADLIESGLCARAHSKLSLRALFDLATAENPTAALTAALEDTSDAIRQAKSAASTPGTKPTRRPSGALPGGRAVAQAVSFRETTTGGFTVRINFDPARTPPETRVDIVTRLEEILRRLKSS